MRFGILAAAVGNSQGGKATEEKDAQGQPKRVPFQAWDFFPRLKPEHITDDGRVLPPPPATQEDRDRQISESLTAWVGMFKKDSS